MAVIAKDASDLLFEFDCAQWAIMSDASKAPWTVVENTCGIQTSVGSPYASSSFLFTLSGIVTANAPITIEIVDGVYVLSLNAPKVYEGVIASNKVIIPTSEFTLPDDINNVQSVVVRRQMYNASTPTDTRDFDINYVDNSIEFESSLGLNGQTAYIKVLV